MSGFTLQIDSSRDGQRIDNYLFANLKGVPKSHIYRLLRLGKIRVNGNRVKQTYRLQIDDRVNLPELRLPQARNKPPEISKQTQDLIENAILYEDDNILVINKPSGAAVHPGTRISYGVIEIVRALRHAAPFLELVHRLDRDTSGCLLIAKNKKMLSELHELLRFQKVHKEYFAALKGKWKQGNKIVNTPLRINKALADNVRDQSTNKKLKNASTTFIPDKIYEEFSLMKVQIGTGRTHQIRIHAAQIEHPVIGDHKYGDFPFNRECRKLGVKRMLLHAYKISFQLPDSGQKYRFTAPLDSGFEDCLDSLVSHKIIAERNNL